MNHMRKVKQAAREALEVMRTERRQLDREIAELEKIVYDRTRSPARPSRKMRRPRRSNTQNDKLVLAAMNGQMRCGEIATAADLSSATTSDALDRLMRRGKVRRVEDPDMKRGRYRGHWEVASSRETRIRPGEGVIS